MFFLFYDNPYIAVIGDIKSSQKLEDRKGVQDKLNKVLLNINEKYQEDISSKFIITLGDEFQGLLCSGNHVMQIIGEIQRKMYPIKIRFGLGIGSITTNINSEMAIGADGPGYYMARKAIEFLKQNEQRSKVHASDVRIEADESNEVIITMINTILLLLSSIKEGWTDRQREIIYDTIKYQDGQVRSAERLNVAQSSIQRGLMKGNYYAYKEALDIVNNVLKEIRRKDV